MKTFSSHVTFVYFMHQYGNKATTYCTGNIKYKWEGKEMRGCRLGYIIFVLYLLCDNVLITQKCAIPKARALQERQINGDHFYASFLLIDKHVKCINHLTILNFC